MHLYSQIMADMEWVLYVSQDKESPEVFCPGSRRCLNIINQLGCDVNVQNVDAMIAKGVELPDWLNGTPILVNIKSKQALKGSRAIEQCKHIQSPSDPPLRKRSLRRRDSKA